MDNRIIFYEEEVDRMVRPYKVTSFILFVAVLVFGLIRWERFNEAPTQTSVRDCVQACVTQ
jgi:hypothetical protein